MHPLTNDLTTLTDQELLNKINEIQTKISMSYRMGNTQLITQLQMIYEDYLFENQKRQQKILDELQKDFGDKINISK